MSSASCLALWPLEACGFHGSCFVDENLTESCICDKGWIQTTEFQFFVGEDEQNKGLCYFNEDFVFALYCIATPLALIALFAQIFVLQNKQQFYRLSASLLSLFCSSLSGIVRLSSPSKALFGEDVLFSFLIATAFAACFISVKRFLFKYTRFIIKSHKLHGAKSKAMTRARLFNKAQAKLMICDAVFNQLFWILCFFDREIKLILFRTSLAGSFVQIIYVVYFSQQFLGEYVSDLQSVLVAEKLKNSINTQLPIGKHNRELYINKWIENHHRKAKHFQKTALYFGLFGTFYFGFALFFDFAVAWWTYLLPVSSSLWSCIVLNAIYLTLGKRKSKSNPQRFINKPGSRNTSELNMLGKSFEQTVMPKKNLKDGAFQVNRDLRSVKSFNHSVTQLSAESNSESSDVYI